MFNVLVAAALLSGSLACPPVRTAQTPNASMPPADTPAPSPGLVIEPVDARYGLVFTNSKSQRRHRITNESDHPITLVKIKTSWAGTPPNPLPDGGVRLQSGETMLVDLALWGNSRLRRLRRTYTLLAIAEPKPKPVPTVLHGIAFSAVTWDPYGLPDRGPTLVTLHSNDDHPFTVLSSYPPDAIRVVDTPIPNTVVVEATAIGRQRDILVRLDHPHCKGILIPVPWDDHAARARPPAAFQLTGEITVLTPDVEAGFVFVGEELVVFGGVFNGTPKPMTVDAAPELQIARSYQAESGDIIPMAITVRGEEPGELNLTETICVDGEEFTVRVHATVVVRPVVIKAPPPPPATAPVQTPKGS